MRDSLEVVEIPGSHWTLLTHRSVGAVAKKLHEAMSSARAAAVDASAEARRHSAMESHDPVSHEERISR